MAIPNKVSDRMFLRCNRIQNNNILDVEYCIRCIK